MRPILALAALAAAVFVLRRLNKARPDAAVFKSDDSEVESEVVGMPTTWDVQLLERLGLDRTQYAVHINDTPLDGHSWYVEFAPTSKN